MLPTSYFSGFRANRNSVRVRWPKLLHNVTFDSMVTRVHHGRPPVFLRLTNAIVYDAYDAYIGTLVHDNHTEIGILLTAFSATPDITCRLNCVTLRITFSYF